MLLQICCYIAKTFIFEFLVKSKVIDILNIRQTTTYKIHYNGQVNYMVRVRTKWQYSIPLFTYSLKKTSKSIGSNKPEAHSINTELFWMGFNKTGCQLLNTIWCNSQPVLYDWQVCTCNVVAHTSETNIEPFPCVHWMSLLVSWLFCL